MEVLSSIPKGESFWIVGAGLFYRSFTGHCPVYESLKLPGTENADDDFDREGPEASAGEHPSRRNAFGARRVGEPNSRLCLCTFHCLTSRDIAVVYLYGSKPGQARTLVATFDTDEQLRAYATWATLVTDSEGISKFEQGSALAGFQRFESSSEPLTEQDRESVVHNPSPSML